MFNIRKKKLKKILNRRYEYSSLRDYLKTLSHKELSLLTEEIIWQEYNDYNVENLYGKEKYYNNLDRDCKEFFIYERSSVLGL